MNLANKISIARIILIPFFVSAIVYGKMEIALAIFIIAALSDGLDGLIARPSLLGGQQIDFDSALAS